MTLIKVYSVILILSAADVRKIASEHAPSGASVSYQYFADGRKSLLKLLSALDTAGCTDMGNENLNASTGDFVDRGRYSKFLNCYSSQRFVAQGFNGLIDGGYFELIEVQSVAIGYEVKNAAVNNWSRGAGGFTDAGSGTRKRSIYDIDTSTFINTTDVRKAATMSLTPVSGGTRGTWLNDTRLPCTVYIQGTASITQATVSRGTDAVNIPTSPVQAVRVEAGDTLTLTWSSSGSGPSLSRRAHTEG